MSQFLMKHRIASIIVTLFGVATATLFFAACNGSPKPATTSATPFNASTYSSEIQKWQSDRLISLTKEDGWLTLIGLFWLNEGENKFGSDPKNPIVLPRDRAPATAGSFWLEKGRVRLVARPEAGIGVQFANGDVKRDRPITTLELKDDNDDGGPTVLYLGSLIINVVKRGERIGVRVKDRESLTRREFTGLEYFPIDPKWRVDARLEPYQPPKIIPITNVLSMTDDETSPGALAFEFDGKTYRVDPILEKGETDWFVMIADETTGRETYGAGRYLYVTPPDATGHVVIDFNKSYSPPCAFTNYATCPLPPRQNHLPLRIEAGEKKYTGPVH